MITSQNNMLKDKAFPILRELIEKYQKSKFYLISNYVEGYKDLIAGKLNLNELLVKFVSYSSYLFQKYEYKEYKLVIDEHPLELHNQFIGGLIKEGADINVIDSSSLDAYNLSITTCEILLAAGLKADFLLERGHFSYSSERYLELALKYNADVSKLNYLVRLPSLSIIEQFLEKGMGSQVFLNHIMSIGTLRLFEDNNSKDDAFKVTEQAIELLLRKGATLDKIYYILWNNAPLSLYDFILSQGIKPQVVLDKAILDFTIHNSANTLDLINLSLSKGAEINNLSSLPRQLSGALLAKLLDIGLRSEVALGLLLETSFELNRKYGEIALDGICKKTEPWQIETQNKTIDKAYDLPAIVSFLFSQIKDINELSPKLRPNIHTLNSLYDNFHISDANPLTPNIYLKLALSSYVGDDRDKLNLQKGLINKVLAMGADFNEIISKFLNKSGDVVISVRDLFFNYKEHLIKYSSADNLFLLSVLVSGTTIKEEKEIILEMIQLAIDRGANVNQEMPGVSNSRALGSVSDPEITKLLIAAGAKCGPKIEIEEMENANLLEIYLNPAFILEQKYKNLAAREENTAKVPYKLHQIWLTSPENPREIRTQDIEIALKSHKIFSKAAVKWDHIVWTNNKTLIPNSVKTFEEAGVKVLSIYEHQDNLRLFPLIENLIASKKWGMASDTLRYSLVEHFGGVYADLNFVFKRDVTSETHKYNYFSKTFEFIYIDNFYFGASKHHPVIKKTLDLVERNLIEPPAYITKINKDSPQYTDLTTANPTYLAYYSEANKYGNIDVVYPQINNITSFLITNEDHQESRIGLDILERRDPDDSSLEVLELLKLACPESVYIIYINMREQKK